MTSSSASSTGTLVLRVDAPTPVVVLLSVVDAAGRTLVRRRVRDRQVVVALPAGDHRLVVSDERAPHDPRRLAGTSLAVPVPAHGVVDATATLVRGGVLRTTTAPWAVVEAADSEGARHQARADGHGRVVLAGLRPGTWSVVAHDRRRDLCSDVVVVELVGGVHTELDLGVTTPAGRLLVDVRGGDRRPVRAGAVVVTDQQGRRVTAPVHRGLADVRGLRPGRVRVVVPASVGHLGTTAEVDVEPGALGHLTVVSPVGATVTGRVAHHGHAAVVALLDEDGVELERTRADAAGRFELGRGLTATNGLTVVATSGPETLHVTQAAVADVCVLTGVRHDLGDIVLPVAGRAAVWSARTPAVAGMRLPSTHV